MLKMSSSHASLSLGSRRKSCTRRSIMASTSSLQPLDSFSRFSSRHSLARALPGSMSLQNCKQKCKARPKGSGGNIGRLSASCVDPQHSLIWHCSCKASQTPAPTPEQPPDPPAHKHPGRQKVQKYCRCAPDLTPVRQVPCFPYAWPYTSSCSTYAAPCPACCVPDLPLIGHALGKEAHAEANVVCILHLLLEQLLLTRP